MSAADIRVRTAFLDGQETAIEAGETILDAARRLGISIPALCHHSGLDPVGGCRLCLVHCEGSQRTVAACHTPLEPGMRIQTHHAEVEDLRRSLLELYFETAPQTGLDLGAIGDGAFSDLVKQYQPGLTDSLGKPSRPDRDRSHPILEYTAGACIHCRLCLSACSEWQNQFVFALDGRGGQARVGVTGGRGFGDSPCVACGACVDLCPTGALSDRDRRRPLGTEVRLTDTVCGFCGVGCGIEVAATEDVVRRIAGIPGAPPNHGHLCRQGRYGHGSFGTWERITKPMLRDGAGFREVTWDVAIEFVGDRISEIVKTRGPDAFGAIASAQDTTETNYLLQKFCRSVIGANNIDSAARFGEVTAAMVLHDANGFGAGTASFDAIEDAHCFVIAGADLASSHPVLAARIRRAVARGARLIVIDPRATELAQEADIFIQPRPGTDATLFNGLAREMVENRLFNLAAIATHAEDATRLRGVLGRYPLKKAAQHSALPVETLAVLAESLAEFGDRALFFHGGGLTRQASGADAVQSFYNLAVLCGAVGRESGGGFVTLGGRSNSQGTIDVGCLPEWLPGHRPANDPAVWPHFRAHWGVDPPDTPGRNCRQMLEAARTGELSALWIMGRELLENQADPAAAAEALKSLDLLVVRDLSYSEQCRHADVILPATTFYEQDGSLTNGERRVQLLRRAVDPPEEALPGWLAIARVARRLGADWPYRDAAEVFAEIARAIPDLMGGISHERLEDEPGGLQWPCPHPGHPGTAGIRLEDLPEGKTRLFTEFVTPYPELANPEFPYLLATGRRPERDRADSPPGPDPSLAAGDDDSIEIHPADAKRAGIVGGGKVAVESRSGRIEAVARLSEAIAPGVVFLSLNRARRLAADIPASTGIPVRIAPVPAGKAAAGDG